MIKNKTWAMLTNEEIEAEAKLTPAEAKAVADLVSAARNLPKNFCVSVDDEGLFVQKRITPGYAHNVAKVKKKSLQF